MFGSLLLVISAWATSTSIGLLVQACDKYRLPTYEKIVERVLGRRARNVVEVSILIFCCGTGAFVLSLRVGPKVGLEGGRTHFDLHFVFLS